MSTARAITPVITLSKNGETVKSFSLEGEALIGRGEGCVIRLEDRAISRQHVLLKPVTGGVQIERKSPFAPLSVNGAEVTRALVKMGDVVEIGPYLMKLAELKQAATQAQAIAEAKLTMEAQQPEATAVALPTSVELQAPALELVNEVAPANAIPSVDTLVGQSIEAPPEPSASPMLSDQPFGAPMALEIAPGSMNADDRGFEQGEVIHSGNISLDSPPEDPAFSVPPPVPAAAMTASRSSPQIEEVSEEAQTQAISISRLEAKLVLRDGREYEISKDEIIIGRAKDCDLTVEDRKASRRNAVIRRKGGRFLIRDLGSANGTHVNGVKLSDEIPLSSEDIIRIGDSELVFHALSTAYAQAELPPPAATEGLSGEISANSAIPSLSLASSAPQDLGNLQPFSDQAVSVNALGQAFASDGSSAPVPPPGAPLPIGMAGDAALPGAAPAGFIPGIDDIPGTSSGGKQSLIEKYRALPPARKAIWTVIIIALFYFLLIEEDEPPVQTKKPVATATQSAGDKSADAAAKKAASLEALTPEQRKDIDLWHDQAYELFKRGEYDKALFELGKIFALVSDYREAREIERYAREGKRQLEAREQERKAAEEAKRVKARIAALVTEITDRMNKKQYAQARELFAEILALDPENEIVSKYSRELESIEEQRRMSEQAKQLAREVIGRAQEVYAEGLALKSRGKYHSAIAVFQRVLEINPEDPRLIAKAKAGIASSRQLIADARDPALAEGKQAEDAGELAKAFKAYERANRADPGHPQARAGMERVRGVLHETAKGLYTEAVLAESYSDFATARQKYQECADTAPSDDVYYQRAKRKLSRYFIKGEVSQ
jgi:pSer/pThr/pTyr-binding forkhead associated (FHA) protein/tetratricopeptide (TPR) repeat protein